MNGSDVGVTERIQRLFNMLTEVPPEFVKTNGVVTQGDKVECKKCTSYKDLLAAWKKAMLWSFGLDMGLSVMLSSVVSVKSVGDQLWVKVMGPASCGKSCLAEGVSVSPHVVPVSQFTGFHSGYRETNDEEEDNSLIASLRDKTMVTKDGDTILQQPNLGQILAEGRDIYDRVSRTRYRNKASSNYSGLNMTWVLMGTSSLRYLDSSELGARFLDVVVMEGIDDDTEDQVLWRHANKSDRNMSIISDGTAVSQHDPAMLAAMQLTGGYVNYLRDNSAELFDVTSIPEHHLRYCTRLGKFVAYMRARPSKLQSELAEREFAARLVGQLVRLTKCLAVVMNKQVVDDEVMQRTKKVAFDTARGVTMRIVHKLHTNPEGMDQSSLLMYLAGDEKHNKKILQFMRDIDILSYYATTINGVRKKPKYRITPKFYPLYRDVMNGHLGQPVTDDNVPF